MTHSPPKRVRKRLPLAILTGSLLALLPIPIASASAAKANTATATCNLAGSPTNLVAYTCGYAGPANPKLTPIKIGWVNNQGGVVYARGYAPTQAIDWGVSYLNKNLGGIDGHPVVLDPCYVENSESEGLTCAHKFLADKVTAIWYGSVVTGATTIDATRGDIPIISAVSDAPADNTDKNHYILFGTGNLIVAGWGPFGKNVLHAKTAAVIYPAGPGLVETATAIAAALRVEGIKTKLVSFTSGTPDLTGPLVAAGVLDVDMINPIVVAPSDCVNVWKALTALGVTNKPIVEFTECVDPSLKSGYGGDYPHIDYGVGSGNALANTPITPMGAVLRKALAQYGLSADVNDPWYANGFMVPLTTAKIFSALIQQGGLASLTPANIGTEFHKFHGPLLLGDPSVTCGIYKDIPSACTGGAYFIKYDGNGKWTSVSPYLEPPLAVKHQFGYTG